MLRSPLIIGFLSFALAGVLSLGTAILSALVIERRSVEEVSTALLEDGHPWALISADGLQVFVSGIAPDEAAAFRAISRAGAVIDADRIVNAIDVEQADTGTAPRFSLDMLRNGEGVQLIGLVPLSTGTDAVDDAIEGFDVGVEITDMVETADYPAPATWAAALDYGLRALSTLPRSKVTVLADRVEVEAISESIEERAVFLSELDNGRPNGVTVVLDISAPRPVITPFAFRAAHEGGAIRLETCTADSEESQVRILSALRDLGVEGLPTCTVGLGVPSPRWGEAILTGLAALDALETGGTLTFTDADVTLVAALGTSQDAFDRIIGELNADLPEVFSLQGVLPEATSATDQGPARFFAALDAETGVSLRGRLPQGAVGESVHAFAMAAFGSDRTDLATRAVTDLPEGWAIRSMAGLMALSELHDGQLTVEPDTLLIQGRSGDIEKASALTRLLAEELGPGVDFQVDIVYDISLDPIASLPSPEVCVERLEAVQTDEKIVFDAGSVVLTEEATQIVDRLAEVMMDCLHVPMEIGGHTDSQGREELNLGLSQSRADAVLNALLARGVLVTNLVARGYGESMPVASNETEAGREQNRRIEFRLAADAEAAAEALALAQYPFEMRPTPRPRTVDAQPASGDGNGDADEDTDADTDGETDNTADADDETEE